MSRIQITYALVRALLISPMPINNFDNAIHTVTISIPSYSHRYKGVFSINNTPDVSELSNFHSALKYDFLFHE